MCAPFNLQLPIIACYTWRSWWWWWLLCVTNKVAFVHSSGWYLFFWSVLLVYSNRFALFRNQASTLTVIYFHRWKNFFALSQFLSLDLYLFSVAFPCLIVYLCYLRLKTSDANTMYEQRECVCILYMVFVPLKLAKWLKGYIHHHRGTRYDIIGEIEKSTHTHTPLKLTLCQRTWTGQMFARLFRWPCFVNAMAMTIPPVYSFQRQRNASCDSLHCERCAMCLRKWKTKQQPTERDERERKKKIMICGLHSAGMFAHTLSLAASKPHSTPHTVWFHYCFAWFRRTGKWTGQSQRS